MKLLFYEAKKVFGRKIFLIVLVLCFVINAFLLYYSQTNDEYNNSLIYSNEYNEMIDEYSVYSFDEAKKLVDDKILAYDILSVFNMLAQTQIEEEIEMYSQQLDEYRNSSPEAYKNAEEMNERRENNLWEQQFLFNISQQLEYIESYPSFIDEMYGRADSQSSTAVFGDKNSFSYKNLYKTADDYAHLKNISLTIGNSNALSATVNYQITDLFVIAVVFLICVYLFSYEREKNLYLLVRSSKYGRLKTIILKLILLYLLSALISLIFTFSDFAINSALYGVGDLSRSVQSISEFRNCVISLTVGQFLLMFALVKAIGIIIITVVFSVVFICFSSTAAMYLTGICAIISEYLLYTYVYSASVLNLLKYINIFYILDSGQFLGSYLNLNIFSNAVTAYPIVLEIFFFIFLACSIISCIVFCIRNQQKKVNILPRLFEKLKLKFFKINGSTSVFKGECFKFLVQNKMAVLILLLVGYGIVSSFGTVRYNYSKESDMAYRAYMEYLEGDITPEKESYIEGQRQYIEELNNRIFEIMENTRLSESAKAAMIRSIDNILKTEGAAFERVEGQFSRLLKLRENGVNARFIDENIYSGFVFNQAREWNNFALICLILLIMLPCIFIVEYKNMMINLICPTKLGKTYLMIIKLIVTFISLIISFAVIYLPYLIRFINTYGTNSFSTPIACIYENSGGSDLSVFGAEILNLSCYIILSVLVAAVIVELSIFFKNKLIAMILSSVFLLIPCLAVYSAGTVRIGYFIKNNQISIIIVVCIISWILIALLLVFAGFSFTKSKVWRKKNAHA